MPPSNLSKCCQIGIITWFGPPLSPSQTLFHSLEFLLSNFSKKNISYPLPSVPNYYITALDLGKIDFGCRDLTITIQDFPWYISEN